MRTWLLANFKWIQFGLLFLFLHGCADSVYHVNDKLQGAERTFVQIVRLAFFFIGARYVWKQWRSVSEAVEQAIKDQSK